MKIKISKRFVSMASVLYLSSAAKVFASTAEAMPWESGLEKIMRSLQGPTTKIIGVILIVGAGIAVAVTEGQAIKKLAWVIAGLGIALQATSFLTMLFGNTSGFVF